MSTFKDLYFEITGTLPDLPVQQAKRFINRAQREAYDSWNWSFLAGETQLNIPDLLDDGTITVTQDSRVITADATAAAVWQALGNFIPITDRSIKIGTDQPYQIRAFDGVDTVYIDRPYPNETETGLTYSMYRPYYAPPDDFNRWVSVVDTVDAWNLIPGKKKEWLDWIDPQRTTIGGPAQFIAFFMRQPAETIPVFGANLSDTPVLGRDLYELWPAPTAAMSLYAYFKKYGADLTADNDTSRFTDNLLISRALCHAYRFASVNQIGFGKTTGKVNWSLVTQQAKLDYMEELTRAIKIDDNINLASIIPNAQAWFPSSSWLQRHLTWGEYSRAYAMSY